MGKKNRMPVGAVSTNVGLPSRLANLPEFAAGGRSLFVRRLERKKREGRTGRPAPSGESFP